MATLEASKKNGVASGEMQTSLSLDTTTGNLKVVTRTFSKKKLIGFTGSVRIVIITVDKEGFTTKKHSYGVNGKSIPGGAHDRTEYWNETIPLPIASKATEAAIIHFNDPKFKVAKVLDAIVKGVTSIVSAYNELKPYIQLLKKKSG